MSRRAIEGQMSIFDMNFEEIVDEPIDEPIDESIDEPAVETAVRKRNKGSVIPEGCSVRNILSGDTYIVLKDMGNCIKVRDSINGIHEMAKLDVEIEK